jgi:hypothetical protein
MDFMKKILFITCLFSMAYSAEPAGLPVYGIYRTASPIVIDGVADEPSWKTADTMKLRLCQEHAQYARIDRYDFQRRVWAKILWDSTFIYFYCYADEDTLWAFHQTRDYWGYWNEIAFEFFFDPDGNGLDFPEAQVTPHGDIADMLSKYGYYSCHGSFDLEGITAAAKVYGTLSSDWRVDAPANGDIDTGFAIEAAIPFSAFGKKFIECKFQGSACMQLGDVLPIDITGDKAIPPCTGDTWRANFFFVTSQPDAQNEPEGDIGNNTRKNWCWSLPNGQDFHDTANFGVIRFIDEIPAATTVARAESRHLTWSAANPGNKGLFARQTIFELSDIAGRRIRCEFPGKAVEGNAPLRRLQGIYIAHSRAGNSSQARKIFRLKPGIPAQ